MAIRRRTHQRLGLRAIPGQLFGRRATFSSCNDAKALAYPSPAGFGYAGGWSLDGPSDSPASRLTHDGSNTLWFASAIIDRKSGHGYGALTNCGGERGVAITSQILERISLRSPST
jgi:hypothetical protein